MRLTHEIVIMGAGPVGLALANCLSLSPFIKSVALVDRKLPTITQVDNPSSVPYPIAYSINTVSLDILRHLNVSFMRYGTLNSIKVYSDDTFVEWREEGTKIVESVELRDALLRALILPHSQKIEMIQGEMVQICNKEYGWSVVRLKDRELRSKLVVGSDGVQSRVKQMSGISSYGWGYRQKAIVCTLRCDGGVTNTTTSNSTTSNSTTSKSTGNSTTAYQYYYQGNTLALLPLWDNYVSLVWSVQLPLFQLYMRMSEVDFMQQLNDVMGWQSESPPFRIVDVCSRREGFPLRSLQAAQYISHRVALVGDAAHTIHPMAGLGVNAGLLDAAYLANNIIRNVMTGNDMGEQIALSEYESKAKALNYGQALAMQLLNEGFRLRGVEGLRRMVLNQLGNVDMGRIVRDNPFAQVGKYMWV